MDENEIVHISPVILDFESFFNESIERMEIEIGKNLAREISNRETDSSGRIEEALIFRKPEPIGFFSFYDAVIGWIIGYDRPDEETKSF